MLQIPDDKFKSILLQDNLLTSSNFDNFLKDATRMGQPISSILISRGIITKEYFYNILERYFGVPRVDLRLNNIREDLLKVLSEDVARHRRVFIFDEEPDGTLKVAMENPADLEAIEFLERRLMRRIKPYLATDEDFERAYSVYGAQLAKDFNVLIADNINASLRSRAKGVIEQAVEVPIVGIIDNILSYGVSLRASDIHIEVLDDVILLRYRIDGILREISRLPKDIHPAIIARLKLLGALKIDEHLQSQDGRFRHKIGEEKVDVRISVLPTFYGEKIVMRLLLGTEKPLSLEELGLLPDMIKIINSNINKTYGMFLVTGPTGSGKTTTLYSMLNILNRPEVNIVTIEDPIEYDMRYSNQTQINHQAGISFASGLRAILRQDPNIIMVGEIRDNETAEIAVHAALTGHLLLSSLHTNDAPTTIPRLIDMNIPPFLVSAVLNIILAQRLVRRICVDCIYSYELDQGMHDLINHELSEHGLINKTVHVPKLFYRGKGCGTCGDSGFRGRFGIFEILPISENLRKIIVSRNFTLDEVSKEARKEGMITMFEDGLRKAERGFTTIEEVLRVIRE